MNDLAPQTSSDQPRNPAEALVPGEIARRAEAAGAEKARNDTVSLLALAVLAGAFIALGAVFSTVVATGAEALPFGVGRLLAGLVFSLGLILVIVGGAELFTGNNLMVMAVASRRITARELTRAWTLVFVGNLVGALGTALLVFLSGHFMLDNGAVGATALAIANAKAGIAPIPAFFLGVLCNVLVCLAVWLCLGAHSTSSRIIAIVPPTAAFVASGFEHSIANMYFIPVGLLIKWGAPGAFWATTSSVPAAYPTSTLPDFSPISCQ